jgi:hypothetical protein
MKILINYWKGFKRRWQIEKDWQVAVILTVFALTGTTTMYVNRWIDTLLGLDESSSFWVKFLVFMIIVLPVYNILLMVYGTLLGQYKFFRFFIVKFFSNILKAFKPSTYRRSAAKAKENTN